MSTSGKGWHRNLWTTVFGRPRNCCPAFRKLKNRKKGVDLQIVEKVTGGSESLCKGAGLKGGHSNRFSRKRKIDHVNSLLRVGGMRHGSNGKRSSAGIHKKEFAKNTFWKSLGGPLSCIVPVYNSSLNGHLETRVPFLRTCGGKRTFLLILVRVQLSVQITVWGEGGA